MNNRVISRILSIIVLSIALAGCATTYNPATGKKEMLLVSTSQEQAMGQDIHNNILKQYKSSGNYLYQKRIKDVGVRVAAKSDRQDISYRFEALESKDLNAFTIPGGYVYATTTLMENATNDDELAAVLAHEIGHTAAKHAAKKIQAAMGYNLLLNAVYALEGDKLKKYWQDIATATNISFQLASLGYSRKDEIEADLLGVRYMSRAGYDPNSMIAFLEKLKNKEGEEKSDWLVFLRSHPYIDDRIKAIRQELDDQKKTY